MRALFLIGLGLLWLTACRSDMGKTQGEKSLTEIKTAGSIRNSDIVRNPVSVGTPEDTVNVAKIAFSETRFDFGEVREGEVVTHTFQFTNDGKQPLIIQNARSTCGCTVPEWPKDPIPPGESGSISVRFDTKNKKEQQTKPITITANTFPSVTRIYLMGYVHPADAEQAAVQ